MAEAVPADPAEWAVPVDATLAGRIGAVAAQSQRDLLRWIGAADGLFAGEGFDVSVLATVTLANAFSAPWLDAEALRMVNRTTLWAFAVDWLVDYRATTHAEVDDVVLRCRAVADGAAPEPDDPLATTLARLRDELWPVTGTAEPTATWAPIWRTELDRMLAAMTTEWNWKATQRECGTWSVTVDEYLANADNLGSSFVNLTHWIATDAPAGPYASSVLDLLEACRSAQRVVRLLNDIATYPRDVAWGDLNVLMLGVSESDIRAMVGQLTDECRRVVAPLREDQPRFATFLLRQVEFCRGFYGITDYWGET